jgi:acyl-CoA hydrolase
VTLTCTGPILRDQAMHRFLIRAADAGYVGFVDGGKLLEWINEVGYEAAARWSGRYCVTAYVGNLHLDRPIAVGELVELHAQLLHTGRTSMHILVTVYSSDPARLTPRQSAQCLTVFVAVDDGNRPTDVTHWTPHTMLELQRSRQARTRIALRKQIKAAMAAVDYTLASTAPNATLRFMAAPTDVNWGGKVHGGRIMRWIDEAGYVCGSDWATAPVIASYFGGIRFYRPVEIGQVVEVYARLIYTGAFSMHFSVHVTAMNTDAPEPHLVAHAFAVFVGFAPNGKRPVPAWKPQTIEDRQLWQQAQRLIQLRQQAEPSTSGGEPPHTTPAQLRNTTVDIA